MDRIKSITFNKEAQNNLPKEVKAKMQADRKQAEKEQLILHGVSQQSELLVCDCKNTCDELTDVGEKVFKCKGLPI